MMAQIQVKEDASDDEHGLGYQTTLMYGRYQRDLGEAAREEARRLRRLQRRRRKDDKRREKELNDEGGKFSRVLRYVWRHTFARLGEDWVFLALLGIIMAVLSFVMDKGISACNNARIWMFRDLVDSPITQYLAWISLSVCLILFSAGFVQIVAPQSIGSGIPEMKTILRGVQLQEYLTFRTLVAKVVGLTATLGSGMPLGKEGPFVHIASIIATLLSKLVTSFQGIYANESRTSEMLAAACAVGVAACFAAPIGGVLFSIEVTTTYFAVRNYWRGFFAACCGATVFKLLQVWAGSTATVAAMFQTHYQMEFPFDPQELIIFGLMGAVAGLVGALWVYLHRKYVLFMRNSKKLNQFLQKNRFIYPGLVALFVSTVTFPLGLGQYMAGDLNTHEQVTSLFANFTWTGNLSAGEEATVSHWKTPQAGVFLTLTIYLISTFFLAIVASTIPVPSGIFIPSFKMGAALGRLVGELTATVFPMGVAYGGQMQPILPGGYACVGAAAVSGAVTHTVSTIVIMFEMTGQVTHIVPSMAAVLIANAVAALLQPSAFDSIILIKRLPYLPELLSSASGLYNICVEDFMVCDVKYIWNKMTFQQLKDMLKENKSIRSFPLVDSPLSMVLLGSIQRPELVKLLDRQVGREKRLQVAAKWQKEAEEQRKKDEEQKKRQRRPSRFEVCPAPDILHVQSGSNSDVENMNLARGASLISNDQAGLIPAPGALFRPKSILKKTNSFTMMRPAILGAGGCSGLTTPTMQHPSVYSTVTGAESRIRMAFEAIFKKSTTLQDVDTPNGDGIVDGNHLLVPGSPNGVDYSAAKPVRTPSISKKVQLPRERVCDMSGEEQAQWEHDEMSMEVDFNTMLYMARRRLNEADQTKEKCKNKDSNGNEQYMCHIDPAPFQLVERTTLLKVHSLFSTLGVSRAYVTAIGRLIGVVALKELRKAIEDVNNGVFVVHEHSSEISADPEALPLTHSIEKTSTKD